MADPISRDPSTFSYSSLTCSTFETPSDKQEEKPSMAQPMVDDVVRLGELLEGGGKNFEKALNKNSDGNPLAALGAIFGEVLDSSDVDIRITSAPVQDTVLGASDLEIGTEDYPNSTKLTLDFSLRRGQIDTSPCMIGANKDPKGGYLVAQRTPYADTPVGNADDKSVPTRCIAARRDEEGTHFRVDGPSDARKLGLWTMGGGMLMGGGLLLVAIVPWVALPVLPFVALGLLVGGGALALFGENLDAPDVIAEHLGGLVVRDAFFGEGASIFGKSVIDEPISQVLRKMVFPTRIGVDNSNNRLNGLGFDIRIDLTKQQLKHGFDIPVGGRIAIRGKVEQNALDRENGVKTPADIDLEQLKFGSFELDRGSARGVTFETGIDENGAADASKGFGINIPYIELDGVHQVLPQGGSEIVDLAGLDVNMKFAAKPDGNGFYLTKLEGKIISAEGADLFGGRLKVGPLGVTVVGERDPKDGPNGEMIWRFYCPDGKVLEFRGDLPNERSAEAREVDLHNFLGEVRYNPLSIGPVPYSFEGDVSAQEARVQNTDTAGPKTQVIATNVVCKENRFSNGVVDVPGCSGQIDGLYKGAPISADVHYLRLQAIIQDNGRTRIRHFLTSTQVSAGKLNGDVIIADGPTTREGVEGGIYVGNIFDIADGKGWKAAYNLQASGILASPVQAEFDALILGDVDACYPDVWVSTDRVSMAASAVQKVYGFTLTPSLKGQMDVFLFSDLEAPEVARMMGSGAVNVSSVFRDRQGRVVIVGAGRSVPIHLDGALKVTDSGELAVPMRVSVPLKGRHMDFQTGDGKISGRMEFQDGGISMDTNGDGIFQVGLDPRPDRIELHMTGPDGARYSISGKVELEDQHVDATVDFRDPRHPGVSLATKDGSPASPGMRGVFTIERYDDQGNKIIVDTIEGYADFGVKASIQNGTAKAHYGVSKAHFKFPKEIRGTDGVVIFPQGESTFEVDAYTEVPLADFGEKDDPLATFWNGTEVQAYAAVDNGKTTAWDMARDEPLTVASLDRGKIRFSALKKRGESEMKVEAKTDEKFTASVRWGGGTLTAAGVGLDAPFAVTIDPTTKTLTVSDQSLALSGRIQFKPKDPKDPAGFDIPLADLKGHVSLTATIVADERGETEVVYSLYVSGAALKAKYGKAFEDLNLPLFKVGAGQMEVAVDGKINLATLEMNAETKMLRGHAQAIIPKEKIFSAFGVRLDDDLVVRVSVNPENPITSKITANPNGVSAEAHIDTKVRYEIRTSGQSLSGPALVSGTVAAQIDAQGNVVFDAKDLVLRATTEKGPLKLLGENLPVVGNEIKIPIGSLKLYRREGGKSLGFSLTPNEAGDPLLSLSVPITPGSSQKTRIVEVYTGPMAVEKAGGQCFIAGTGDKIPWDCEDPLSLADIFKIGVTVDFPMKANYFFKQHNIQTGPNPRVRIRLKAEDGRPPVGSIEFTDTTAIDATCISDNMGLPFHTGCFDVKVEKMSVKNVLEGGRERYRVLVDGKAWFEIFPIENSALFGIIPLEDLPFLPPTEEVVGEKMFRPGAFGPGGMQEFPTPSDFFRKVLPPEEIPVDMKNLPKSKFIITLGVPDKKPAPRQKIAPRPYQLPSDPRWHGGF